MTIITKSFLLVPNVLKFLYHYREPYPLAWHKDIKKLKKKKNNAGAIELKGQESMM